MNGIAFWQLPKCKQSPNLKNRIQCDIWLLLQWTMDLDSMLVLAGNLEFWNQIHEMFERCALCACFVLCMLIKHLLDELVRSSTDVWYARDNWTSSFLKRNEFHCGVFFPPISLTKTRIRWRKCHFELVCSFCFRFRFRIVLIVLVLRISS